MRESTVEARLRRGVQAIGGMSAKMAPTEKGIPDRLVLLPGGRVFLVELKAIGGRLSPSQKYWHQRAADRGVIVVVLTGPGEVDAWIKENRND